MITMTTRLILMALLCWWLAKEHKFRQNQQAVDQSRADFSRANFVSSVEGVEEYSYLRQDEFLNS